MRTSIELSTLTDGSPWTTKKVFGTVPTAGDYHRVVSEADRCDYFWRAITTPAEIQAKRRFVDQYFLNRNELLVIDDFRDVVADSLLISRCLNTCRMFAVAGGRALWVNHPRFVDVSGTNAEFLGACAGEALCN
jgi:hypothetical protein